MAKHANLINWEKRLDVVLREIDEELEDTYGGMYPLHPSRAPEGTTANPKYDGLFTVEAKFSAGFGSELGRGYVISIHMATLADVPDDVEAQIHDGVAALLTQKLKKAFDGRDLHVERDGATYKLHGDLSLGSL